MDEMEAYAHELMQERERTTIEALQRCIKAGARAEDIKTLCRETGVNVQDVMIGDTNAADH